MGEQLAKGCYMEAGNSRDSNPQPFGRYIHEGYSASPLSCRGPKSIVTKHDFGPFRSSKDRADGTDRTQRVMFLVT